MPKAPNTENGRRTHSPARSPLVGNVASSIDPESSTPKSGNGTESALLDPPLESCNAQKRKNGYTYQKTHQKSGQKKPEKEWRCPYSQTLLAYDEISYRLHAFELNCKRWPCPICGRRKAKELAEKTVKAKPNRFVTLTTAHHRDQTPREAYDFTRRRISQWVTRLRRKHGEIEYLRVLEPHKSGYPHYHLIVRSGYLEQQELSRHWCELTDAFIVDIRKIQRQREVVRYIMKYVTKVGKITFTDRRVSWTRKFFVKESENEKRNANWFDPRTYVGHIEDVTRWEAEGIKWDKLSQAHWVSIRPGESTTQDNGEDDSGF